VRRGRAAVDSSGHSLNGAYVNEPNKVAGPIGNAVKFDGTDYIDLGRPAALQLTSSMTVSAWIKSSYDPRDDAVIVSSRFKQVGFQLDTTDDNGPRTIGFKLTSPCGTMMARYGATPLALDTWYYVTGVYDAEAKTMDVYLNGELDNGVLAGPVMGMQKASGKDVYIGRRSDFDGLILRRSDSDRFTGEIDDLRIYSVPLTQTEIVADMRGIPREVQPVAHADHGGKPSSLDQTETCSGLTPPGDEKIPAAAVVLGVLAAIACAGLLPACGLFECLLAGLVAALLFVFATASSLPMLARWMVPLLSLAGAASVGLTFCRGNAAERETREP
jgi:hypothetical protein